MASGILSSKVLLGDSRRLKVNGHDLPGGIQDFSLSGTELYAPAVVNAPVLIAFISFIAVMPASLGH